MKVPRLVFALIAIALVLLGGFLVVHRSTELEPESTPVQVTECSQTVDSVALNTQRSVLYTCVSTGNSTLVLGIKAKQPLLATVTFTGTANATTLLYNVTGTTPSGNFPTVFDGTFRVKLTLLQTSVDKVTGTVTLLGQEIESVEVATTVYPYRDYGALAVAAGAILFLAAYWQSMRELLGRPPAKAPPAA